MENKHINSQAQKLVMGLCAKGKWLALAESCTGGLVAAAITSVAGSSECFGYGIVSYSNQAKESLLQVRPATLEAYGAVSEETALEMVTGLQGLSQADLALSVTGIAGPGGGSAEKPVGLVYFGLWAGGRRACFSERFQGDREEIRRQTLIRALEILQQGLDML